MFDLFLLLSMFGALAVLVAETALARRIRRAASFVVIVAIYWLLARRPIT